MNVNTHPHTHSDIFKAMHTPQASTCTHPDGCRTHSTARIATFLGDELRGNSNLKRPKHRGVVAGDDVICATWGRGVGMGAQVKAPYSLLLIPKAKAESGQGPPGIAHHPGREALTIGIADDVGLRIGFPENPVTP